MFTITNTFLNKYFITLYIIMMCVCYCSFQSIGQDTIFLRSHTFKERVNNIDGDGKNLIVRLEKTLYRFLGEQFEEINTIDLKQSRFTWLSSVADPAGFKTYNTDFLVKNKIVNRGELDKYIPGNYHYDMTKARVGNRLFIAYRGNLLEFEIRDFYTVVHRSESVRFVYNNDSLRIISSYTGIYIDSNKIIFTGEPVIGTYYSNGETNQIDNNFYLCQDDLYKLEDGRFVKFISSSNQDKFRKLLKQRDDCWFMTDHAVGIINLNTREVKNRIYNGSSNYNDIESVNGNLWVATAEGTLLRISQNDKPSIIQIGNSVFDILPDGKDLILSCREGIYRYSPEKGSLEKIINHFMVIQSIRLDKYLLFTTYDGLFLYYDDKLYPIIENIEFNKKALSVWDNTIYAGSIEGLYLISREKLLYDLIPSLTPIDLSKDDISPYIYSIFVLSFLILGIFYIRLRKSKKKIEVQIYKKKKITPDSIREAMFANEKLVSVEQVAEFFNTSTVQLNRHLKKYDTSALKLMKEIKRDIVIDMINKQASLEMISIRVGYSTIFIKRNFIKDI